MTYTFHQLQLFMALVEYGSITKAASQMNMTQPALSIQLKNFQHQFGLPLYEVIGKKVFISDFGHVVAKVGRDILREAEILNYKTKQYKNLMAGKLRISSASTGKYVLPYYLTNFMHLHTSVDLALDVSNKSMVMEHLKDNLIDFAFISVLPGDVELDEELILENRLHLVANSKTPDPDLPLIFREEGSATRKAMDYYFRKDTKHKRLILTSNEAVKQAVMAGLGLSILPLIGIKNELLNGSLHLLQAPDLPIITQWRLVWLKNKNLSPIARAFLEYVRGEKQQVLKQHFNWINEYP